MRSRISLPIADHPTVLDSKNIMPYTNDSRFFPQEWDIYQDVLDRDPERAFTNIRRRIADLYEHSFDENIVGLKEYQNNVLQHLRNGDVIIDNEIHYFHKQFVSMLYERITRKNVVSLDLKDSSEFPGRRGIYFCVRCTHSDVEVWYVGKTKNFKDRWKAHHKFQALQAIRWVDVYCLPLDDYSDEDLDYAERVYIHMLRPAFNGTSNPNKHLRPL